MKLINLLDAIFCLIILLRLLLFKKPEHGTHRKMAAIVAYAIIVGAGCWALQLLFFKHQSSMPQLLLNFMLMLIVVSSKGNVVDIFHSPSVSNNGMYQFVREVWDADGFHFCRFKKLLIEPINHFIANLKQQLGDNRETR